MIPLRENVPPRKRSAQEDIEFEIAFFEGVAQRDPNYIEALQILGDAYTRTGQWEKSLPVDERLAHLCPENPLVFFNLACSYSLLNRVDEAIGALEKAVGLGYTDTGWLDSDPDLENARKDPRFARVREKLSGNQPSSGPAT
jgi:tetratricopeptide (TPR) repeat protein